MTKHHCDRCDAVIDKLWTATPPGGRLQEYCGLQCLLERMIPYPNRACPNIRELIQQVLAAQTAYDASEMERRNHEWQILQT